MGRHLVIVVLGVILHTSCGLVSDTSNLGGGFDEPPRVILTAPQDNLAGGQTSTWTASWIGDYGNMGINGEPPNTIEWDFGGGAANIPSVPATSPATAEATWDDVGIATTYTVFVTLTNGMGLSSVDVRHVTIEPTPNRKPVTEDVDVIGDVASVEGELFNFQVTYSSAGEKHIGFQEFNGVNRTCYSDLASGELTYWGKFVEGTIIVTE